MAQATLEDSMSEEAAPSVAFIIARNGDPLTLALRNGEYLSNEHLLRLTQASSSASTSVRTSPTTVFSSREPSIVTKPTSYGTSYPAHNHNGKEKVDTTYAESLSATHGSDSESEVEHDDARRQVLLGAGAWSSGPQVHGHCLRRSENAKVRLSKALPHRLKKPLVVLHQSTQEAVVAACQDDTLRTLAAPMQTEAGPMCPRHRMPGQHYALLVLISLIVLTIFLSGRHLYLTDKTKLPLLRRTAFVATLLVTLEVVVTMLVARRTLLDASVLGLFPLITGFIFMTHLDYLV